MRLTSHSPLESADRQMRRFVTASDVRPVTAGEIRNITDKDGLYRE